MSAARPIPPSIRDRDRSDSVPLKGVEVDEKRIVTSTGALELDKVPGHLVVIGQGDRAGTLACSGAGWVLSDRIEFLNRITPGLDTRCPKHFRPC